MTDAHKIPDDEQRRLRKMATCLQRLATCVHRRRILNVLIQPAISDEHDETNIFVALPNGEQLGCVLGQTEKHIELLTELVHKCTYLPDGGQKQSDEGNPLNSHVIVESIEDGAAAKITRLDGATQVVRSLDDMWREMTYCKDKWPGANLNDKRDWKFPGEK